ncbi:hypothetical protein PpBr36_02010 [Pyricularia pennisetigena]|uniref:hypothetical protein n=1 Tax=Pyricularia pennisetigena TaxID=1578925 RepID=UPI00114FF1C2|nr:hypothetical protein PpBr36_02010 [Pyricularia pennisetigena]TLS29069.1 hypothetical protein PpBr36_02010 [Pyricularia pennisetigena]
MSGFGTESILGFISLGARPHWKGPRSYQEEVFATFIHLLEPRLPRDPTTAWVIDDDNVFPADSKLVVEGDDAAIPTNTTGRPGRPHLLQQLDGPTHAPHVQQAVHVAQDAADDAPVGVGPGLGARHKGRPQDALEVHVVGRDVVQVLRRHDVRRPPQPLVVVLGPAQMPAQRPPSVDVDCPLVGVCEVVSVGDLGRVAEVGRPLRARKRLESGEELAGVVGLWCASPRRRGAERVDSAEGLEQIRGAARPGAGLGAVQNPVQLLQAKEL